MLNSLKLYTKYFSLALISMQKLKYLLNDFKRSKRKKFFVIPVKSPVQKKEALQSAINWLLRAQQMMPDDGFGSFHLINGWSSSYPETSGYIIPTLLESVEVSGEDVVRGKALQSAEWLISIQKESGGWQGGRINESKPEIVFNTGQVIRGLLAAYSYTDESKYLDSARKAANWLCDVQHENGYWKKNALMEQPRVYDSYVDAPLLHLWKITNETRYKKHAIRNLNWIVDLKQLENGWFEDCDNTVKRNDKPILHTISYTIDGLLDCGMLLEDEKYIRAACKPADILLHKFVGDSYLNSRFNRQWHGSEYMMVTGSAQIAIVWLKLANLKNSREYYDAACRMIDLLIYVQDRDRFDLPDLKGAMPGSFPIWGRYEPFAFPNWASKYFCDLLYLRTKNQENFSCQSSVIANRVSGVLISRRKNLPGGKRWN
ncbi:MAG: glycoside hydrolase family 127 protein [Bacteroidota bacterium]|nr:glycoside hydrolase family 127 protein [Bacteroidota bacterium]